MRQNVLDEIQKPQKEPRQTQVVKTYQIVRDAKTYDLYTYPDWCTIRESSIPVPFKPTLTDTKQYSGLLDAEPDSWKKN